MRFADAEPCAWTRDLRLWRFHEALGNRYRALAEVHGIRKAPPVEWVTPLPSGRTVAVIHWPDGTRTTLGSPQAQTLPDDVVCRVLRASRSERGNAHGR